jgi:hypothetical protein
MRIPETMTEFINRRFDELSRSSEWDEIGTMMGADILKMLESEFYDRAEDPVPEPRSDVTLQ